MKIQQHLLLKPSLIRQFLLMCICMVFSIAAFGQQAAVKLFAHRAAAHELDENTMSAFKESYEKGMRGFETDIRRTKDGKLVIFHDDNFERIVGLKGGVEDITLVEFKKLRTKKGNEMPTLAEVVQYFSDKPGVYIEFEMKTNKPVYKEKVLHQYCDELYNRVYSNRPKDSEYLLTSFDKRPLKYLNTTYPDVDLLLIKSEGLSQKLIDEAKELGVKRIGARVEMSTRNMVTAAKKQGMTITLWPGRSVDDFLLGLSLGADYLCSDVPLAVTDWVKKNAPWIELK